MTTDAFKSYNSHATPTQRPGQKNHNHFEAVPLWRMHPPAPAAGATSVTSVLHCKIAPQFVLQSITINELEHLELHRWYRWYRWHGWYHWSMVSDGSFWRRWGYLVAMPSEYFQTASSWSGVRRCSPAPTCLLTSKGLPSALRGLMPQKPLKSIRSWSCQNTMNAMSFNNLISVKMNVSVPRFKYSNSEKCQFSVCRESI